MAEILEVLAHFGIVHSDLKPDNILVEMNEQNTDIQNLKLIDFGSAFEFHNVTQITATTPEYLAPEMIRQSGHDKSLDIWNLGVLLFELLTGNPPFVGKD